MFTLPFILAAGSLPLISGAPVPSSLFSVSADTESTHSLTGRSSNLYASVFGGDGLVSEGWPSLVEWITSFDDMFENNKEIMSSSCAQWNVPNNSEEEITHIKNSIQSVAQSSSVDPRFVLAIVMQESNGCVRVQTTDNGVMNPGLMQSHDGTGSCNTGNGQVLNPCPESQILQMIKDGTEGTAAGAGLQQCLAQEGGSGVTAYYKAARCYNSGSVAASGNLGQGIATHCYVSDIANRLLGWSAGTSNCNGGLIGSLTGSSWSDSGSGSSSSAAPEPTSTSEPAATVSATLPPSVPTLTPEPSSAEPTTVVPVLPAATSSAAPTPSASSGAVPLYPYASSSCQEYATIVAGDFCQKIDAEYGISESQLRSLNPGLDEACSNLWKGYQYCIKA